ncbi:MAG: hypothetical protein FWC45_09465 [Treponema sp.]|nr:hypothetical protein [Treponema sp.]
MKIRGLVLLAAGAFFVFLSCAGSPDAYAPIDAGIRSGSFENAISLLESGSVRKTVYTPRNQILFYLDRGMLKHYAELYRDSSDDLQTAEQLIEDAFTRSISQEIGSYLLNDNVKDYSGEDYEDLYINVFNALNYYYNNSIEGALVEIRRLNEKLNFLADKYERAKEKVLDSNKQVDPRQLPMEASRFSNSALARYLGLLFYRGTGRTDSARIDYEELCRAYDLAPAVYTNPIPSSVADELTVPEGMGRLNVIAFTGLSPVKQETNIFIPLPFPYPNNMARLALPRMAERPGAVQRAEAVLDNGEKFPLELLEDMGAVARETFKSRYSLMVLKTTARAITKAAASASLARAASKNSGKGSDFGPLVGLLGRVFTEVSEQADLRLSRYFPNNALVGGINLEPGVHKLRVDFYGKSGLEYSEDKEITVIERSLNLEEFICLK